MTDPFHEGEVKVQRAAGEDAEAFEIAGMVTNRVTPAGRRFVQAQRMLISASRDNTGDYWASMLFGNEGFASIGEDGRSLVIDRSRTSNVEGDPFWNNLLPASHVGFLAIDLISRRRLRMNGRITSLTQDRLVVDIEEAYPNCPKYIQARRLLTPSAVKDNLTKATVAADTAAELIDAIRRADTCFVASGHPIRGLDASHRGGDPGFIEVIDDRTLRIPDYVGNSMFNTLGNFAVDARCGLTVVDFENRSLYQMTGNAVAHFGQRKRDDSAGCTGRFWDFQLRHWRGASLPLGIAWQLVDYSPYNPTSCNRSDDDVIG